MAAGRCYRTKTPTPGNTGNNTGNGSIMKHLTYYRPPVTPGNSGNGLAHLLPVLQRITGAPVTR